MDWAINNAQPMLWSNFLVTINSNVRPLTLPQRIGMTQWLRDGLETLFSDFDLLNGRVLKPAGSPNNEGHLLDYGDILGVRVAYGIEEAPKTGLVHAHVLIEVCHLARELNAWGMRGVHTNREGIRAYFDNNIGLMPVLPQQRPQRTYVNVRLLTKGTDNSNKWLTLQYIDKDTDIRGRDLRADREAAPENLRRVRQKILDEGVQVDLEI